jgi:hypothetical protein
MAVVNSELYNASRAYLSAALQLLEERCGDASKLPREESDEWNEVGANFHLQRRSKPDWAVCIRIVEEEMHALPEYVGVMEQLNADPTVSQHLDAMVGSSMGGSRIEASGLADSFIWHSLNRLNSYEFSGEVFNEDYTALETELYSDIVESVTLMPLAGFSSAVVPLKLTDQVSIIKLSVSQIRKCIKAGLIRPMLIDRIIISPPRYAIQILHSLPKVIKRDREMEDGSERDLKDAQEFFSREDATLEAVVAALRVFRRGTVRPLGKLGYDARKLSLGEGLTFAPKATYPYGDYSLTESEAESFLAICRILNSDKVRKNKSLSTAIRRFNYSADRERLEDRMLDLMIAGEALFLSGTTEELRYRFALRAASFIEAPGWSREQVFRFMRLAYDVRSKIAHGDDLPKLSMPDLPTVELQSFVDTTENRLRSALHRALEIAGRTTGTWPPNWDEVILFSRAERLDY